MDAMLLQSAHSRLIIARSPGAGNMAMLTPCCHDSGPLRLVIPRWQHGNMKKRLPSLWCFALQIWQAVKNPCCHVARAQRWRRRLTSRQHGASTWPCCHVARGTPSPINKPRSPALRQHGRHVAALEGALRWPPGGPRWTSVDLPPPTWAPPGRWSNLRTRPPRGGARRFHSSHGPPVLLRAAPVAAACNGSNRGHGRAPPGPSNSRPFSRVRRLGRSESGCRPVRAGTRPNIYPLRV